MNSNTLARRIVELGGRCESNLATPSDTCVEAYRGTVKAVWWASNRTGRTSSVYVKGGTHGMGDSCYHTTSSVLSAMFGHTRFSRTEHRGCVTAHRSFSAKGKVCYTLLRHGLTRGEVDVVTEITMPKELVWMVASYLDDDMPADVLLDALTESEVIG